MKFIDVRWAALLVLFAGRSWWRRRHSLRRRRSLPSPGNGRRNSIRRSAIRKYLYEFKVDGEKLTGKAHRDVEGQKTDTDITEGKVSGDQISFVEMLKFNDQDLRIEYKGKIADDQIKLTRAVGDFATNDIVLKRAPATQPATEPAMPGAGG